MSVCNGMEVFVRLCHCWSLRESGAAEWWCSFWYSDSLWVLVKKQALRFVFDVGGLQADEKAKKWSAQPLSPAGVQCKGFTDVVAESFFQIPRMAGLKLQEPDWYRRSSFSRVWCSLTFSPVDNYLLPTAAEWWCLIHVVVHLMPLFCFLAFELTPLFQQPLDNHFSRHEADRAHFADLQRERWRKES